MNHTRRHFIEKLGCTALLSAATGSVVAKEIQSVEPGDFAEEYKSRHEAIALLARSFGGFLVLGVANIHGEDKRLMCVGGEWDGGGYGPESEQMLEALISAGKAAEGRLKLQREAKP